MISAIWAAVSFADRQNSGKTVLELEAEAERLENSVMPAADTLTSRNSSRVQFESLTQSKL